MKSRIGTTIAACLLLLTAAHQAAALTIDQAMEISQQTGRPIFAVAGSAT